MNRQTLTEALVAAMRPIPKGPMPLALAESFVLTVLSKAPGVPPIMTRLYETLLACSELAPYFGQYHVLDGFHHPSPTSAGRCLAWTLRRATRLAVTLSVEQAAAFTVNELVTFKDAPSVSFTALAVIGGVTLEKTFGFAVGENAPRFFVIPMAEFRSDPALAYYAEFLANQFRGQLTLSHPSAVLMKEITVSSRYTAESPPDDQPPPQHTFQTEMEPWIHLSVLGNVQPAFPLVYWTAPPEEAPIQSGAMDYFAPSIIKPRMWTRKDLISVSSGVAPVERLAERDRFRSCLRRLYKAATAILSDDTLTDAAIDARIAYEMTFVGTSFGERQYRASTRAALYIGSSIEERISMQKDGEKAYQSCSGAVHAQKQNPGKLRDAAAQLIVQTMFGLRKILTEGKFPIENLELLGVPLPAAPQGDDGQHS